MRCQSSAHHIEGRYRLEVTIVQDTIDPLGYRRDPQKINGKIRKH
jgi:hypothetical protein